MQGENRKVMTIFSKIINGEIPSYKVAENEKFYAFLDINPLQKGHTLVVPKLAEPEADYIFDLEDDVLSEMLVFAKQVARGIKGAMECKRVGVAVIGLEVPHVHMHLIPISKEGDMSFANPKMTLPADEMAEIANAIAKAMEC
jgi:histidine triad (HIT) family protein